MLIDIIAVLCFWGAKLHVFSVISKFTCVFFFQAGFYLLFFALCPSENGFSAAVFQKISFCFVKGKLLPAKR